MMASIFLSRVMGLVREMVIAGVAGADTAVDAYRVAFVVPEILNHILASGFLSVTFIPIFSRYLAEKCDDEGWRVFSLILTVFGAFLLVLILVAEIFAPSLIGLLAPGRTDPVFLAMAVRMTRIILPAQFFFFAGGLLMAVQFAREQFFIPALAPLVYNLGIILGGVLLAAFCGMEGFAWGVLGGSLVGNFAIQIWGARRIGMRFAPVWDVAPSRPVALSAPDPAPDVRFDHDVFHGDFHQIFRQLSAGRQHCLDRVRHAHHADAGGVLRPGRGRGLLSLHGPHGGGGAHGGHEPAAERRPALSVHRFAFCGPDHRPARGSRKPALYAG